MQTRKTGNMTAPYAEEATSHPLPGSCGMAVLVVIQKPRAGVATCPAALLERMMTRENRDMSHHGNSEGPIDENIRQILGATGDYPEGKLTEDDEGGIQFAVGVKDGQVCLDFGKPVAWIGMNPGDALSLAETLIANARKAAKGSGSILTLNF